MILAFALNLLNDCETPAIAFTFGVPLRLRGWLRRLRDSYPRRKSGQRRKTGKQIPRRRNCGLRNGNDTSDAVRADGVPVPRDPSGAGADHSNAADADGTPDRHSNDGGAA